MSIELFEKVLARRLPLSDDKNNRTPGVQVVVVSSKGTVFSGARGFADPLSNTDGQELLTPNHQANIYSVSKFFTACCILKLVEQGRLSLSTRARDVLPEAMRDLVNECTVEQLITHTASAPNPLPLSWVHGVQDEIEEESELIDVLTKNPLPKSIPSSFQYSNVGYWILGAIIAHVYNMPMSSYAQLCDALLFEGNLPPLVRIAIGTRFSNKRQTQVGYVSRWSILGLASHLMVPSWLFGETSKSWMRMNNHYLNGASFGGMVSSSEAVSSFLRCILKGKVLSSDSRTLLLNPQTPQMTMGLHVRTHRGMPVYHKEGGGAGCHSSIHFRPYHDLAACVIAGDATYDVNGLLDEILDIAADHRFDSTMIRSKTKYVRTPDGREIHTKSFSSNAVKRTVCAEPMLLIHGGPGVPDYLEPLAQVLLQSGLARTVITFDQRGVGKSKDAFVRNLSMEMMVSDIDCVREAYYEKKLHVVGHSWGGVLARLYAAKHPSHVSSLVLLSPSPVSEKADWNAMEKQVMKNNLRQCGWMKFTAMGIYSLLMIVPGRIGSIATQKLFSQVIKNYFFDPTSAPAPSPLFLSGTSARACFAAKKAFVRDVTQPIRVPASIDSIAIFGDRDIYGSDLVSSFSKNTSHRVKVIANAGHLTWIDKPKELRYLLKSFWSRSRKVSFQRG